MSRIDLTVACSKNETTVDTQQGKTPRRIKNEEMPFERRMREQKERDERESGSTDTTEEIARHGCSTWGDVASIRNNREPAIPGKNFKNNDVMMGD